MLLMLQPSMMSGTVLKSIDDDLDQSTVICKNLVSAKVNKIELDSGLEGSDYAASIGAIRISVPCFKTEIFNSKNLASLGPCQAQ